ncbi:MAG: methyltransferase domain-containing protein [Stellaceae bacterium]
MCRGTRLHKFLDLGKTPPADRFLFEHQLKEKEELYPLNVVICDDCGLVQLDYAVAPEILYCDDYPYESSTTSAGHRHWSEFAETVTRMMSLEGKDLVVDIGSNVGVLLQMFKDRGIRVLGVDPAANIAAIANRNGIETEAAFFDEKIARQIVLRHGHASVITGTNVFAHLNDVRGVMRAVDDLLADRGVFIVEAPYLLALMQDFEYDTIYHEHLSYLSLKPLQRFFAGFGMEIFEVQRRDIHGGSFRFFVQRKKEGRPVSPVITELLYIEEREGIYNHDRLKQFADQVAKNRDDLRNLLLTLKSHGKRIAAVSAPAKGMTLVNYCGLDNTILDFVTEKARLKIGRYTPGMHIPVVADEVLFEKQPDYALLLAWNFAEEIMANLKRFSDHGGKFIIPVPTPKIVG